MAVTPMDEVGQEPFRIEITAGDDGVRVAVHGSLDLGTVADLHRVGVALRGTTGPVTLDLAPLSFLDSTGITALVSLKGELDVQMRSLTVVGVRPDTLDLLRMLGVDEALGLSG